MSVLEQFLKEKRIRLWFEFNYNRNNQKLVIIPKSPKKFLELFGDDCEALELSLDLEKLDKDKTLNREYQEYFNKQITK